MIPARRTALDAVRRIFATATVWVCAAGLMPQSLRAQPNATPVEEAGPAETKPQPELRQSVALPAPPADLAGWLAGLDSDDFQVREEAVRRLLHAGPAAVPYLAEAARSRNPEIRWRALRVLKQAYAQGAPEAMAVAAEDALDDLRARGGSAVQDSIDTVLASQEARRERRALEELRRLGAKIGYDDRVRLRDDAVLGRIQIAGTEGDPVISHVFIGREWTGGDAGLKLLRRLRTLRAIYVTPDTPVTQESLAQILAELPSVQLQKRGRACLGVLADPLSIESCVITGVQAGSAAAKAGLAAGDLVQEFGGKPVQNFDQLVELIAAREPGDKVAVKINRDGQIKTLEVVLEEWKQTP